MNLRTLLLCTSLTLLAGCANRPSSSFRMSDPQAATEMTFYSGGPGRPELQVQAGPGVTQVEGRVGSHLIWTDRQGDYELDLIVRQLDPQDPTSVEWALGAVEVLGPGHVSVSGPDATTYTEVPVPISAEGYARVVLERSGHVRFGD